MNSVLRVCAFGAVLVLTMAGGGVLTGCKRLPKRPTPVPSPPAKAAASDAFEVAWLFKPGSEAALATWATLFAPLLLVESPSEGLPTSPASLRLLAHEEQTWLGGQVRRQILYVWRWNGDPGNPQRMVEAWQGFRIWLGRSGQPLLWETLRSGEQPALLFVARHWEQEAESRLGPPQAPRRWAVERPRSGTSPKARIVELFDDAPMPMGPIVHLSGAGEIRSLICRCSPARVRRLAGQSLYALDLLVNAIGTEHTGAAVPGPGTEAWLSPAELEALLHWFADL
jgi:hypothetical protein